MEQKNPFKGYTNPANKHGFADNWNSVSGGVVKIKNRNDVNDAK